MPEKSQKRIDSGKKGLHTLDSQSVSIFE
jgi:hypothetical protein